MQRDVLLQVVRACVANHAITGLAFPCLEVNTSEGEDRGYIVLRRPGLRDIVLAPTKQVVGIENPWLRTAEAPNYFQDAWNARSAAHVNRPLIVYVPPIRETDRKQATDLRRTLPVTLSFAIAISPVPSAVARNAADLDVWLKLVGATRARGFRRAGEQSERIDTAYCQ